MTGTDVARFTHNQSRSYLNHLVILRRHGRRDRLVPQQAVYLICLRIGFTADVSGKHCCLASVVLKTPVYIL